jgi:TetR/AcrR family transcriptional repressor of nem operon
MARPREFEPNEALNRAMQLFWQKGYEDTSMAELVDATGVSRYGFYTEFGDKHDLFLKCMDRYANSAIEMMLSPMEGSGASLAEIRSYFGPMLAEVTSDQPPIGCLIGNTAMSAPHLDSSVFSRIEHHYTRMRAAFLNALQNAVEQGELPSGTDCEALADYFVGIANGYLVCIRSSMAPAAVRRFLEVALEKIA